MNLATPPRFNHYCEKCTYLGPYEKTDLYICGTDTNSTVLARFSSEDADYISGMPSSYASYGPLSVARQRAQEKGLTFYDITQAVFYLHTDSDKRLTDELKVHLQGHPISKAISALAADEISGTVQVHAELARSIEELLREDTPSNRLNIAMTLSGQFEHFARWHVLFNMPCPNHEILMKATFGYDPIRAGEENDE